MQSTGSFKSFFSALIDYAGLFPPATLPLRTALENYHNYLHSDDAWMLGSFIVPAALLDELRVELQRLPVLAEPLPVSVLVSNAAIDLPVIKVFMETHASQIKIAALETKFLTETTIDPVLLEFLRTQKSAPAVFVELVADSEWELLFPRAVEVLRSSAGENKLSLAFKLRCGGVSPDRIPSIDQVAQVIHGCASAAVPLKCTAGLHQPFRHIDENLQVPFHGFFNLFFTGMLAFADSVSIETLLELLADEGSPVLATEDTISWLGYELDVNTIRACRTENIISFGSCSFTEPVLAAKHLGWI